MIAVAGAAVRVDTRHDVAELALLRLGLVGSDDVGIPAEGEVQHAAEATGWRFRDLYRRLLQFESLLPKIEHAARRAAREQVAARQMVVRGIDRSEEHTSELQSLAYL